MSLLPNNGGLETTNHFLPVHSYLHEHGVETEIIRASDGGVVVTMEVDESLPVFHSNRAVPLSPARREAALLFMYKCNRLELKDQGYRFIYQRPEQEYINKNDIDSTEFDHIVALARKFCFRSSDSNLQRHFRDNEHLLKYLANTEPHFTRQQRGNLKFDNHAQFYFDNEAIFQDWWNDFQTLRAHNSVISEKLSHRSSHNDMKHLAAQSKDWYKLATLLKQKWNIYTPPDMLGAMDEYNE